MWTAVYIGLIVLVNYGFSVVPLVPFLGEMWPPMSLAGGLIFVVRDFAQREIGHQIIVAMLVGGIFSYFMADPFVAVASVVAFLISEVVDWAVYTFTNRPLSQRIVYSSLLATPIDSTVFLAMIGHLSVTGVAVMTLSKMLGAVVVWQILRKRCGLI